VRQLAGAPRGAGPGAGLGAGPLVPHGVRSAPGPRRHPGAGGRGLGDARPQHPLAPEASAGLWSASQLALWWVDEVNSISKTFI